MLRSEGSITLNSKQLLCSEATSCCLRPVVYAESYGNRCESTPGVVVSSGIANAYTRAGRRQPSANRFKTQSIELRHGFSIHLNRFGT